MFINFDDDAIPSGINVTGFVMSASYQLIEGEHEERVSAVKNEVIDGRWLLSAQHLECWRQLWAPHVDGLLPSLDLLLSCLLYTSPSPRD